MTRQAFSQVRSQKKVGNVHQKALPINQAEVARVAYQLFERRGRVHGHDLQDWLEAERIIRQRQGNGSRR